MFEPLNHRSEMDLDRTMGGQHQELTSNVGAAVILAAIADMKRGGELRASAQRFLYPVTAEHQERFSWAVQVSGADEKWLRQQLDTAKQFWYLVPRGTSAQMVLEPKEQSA